MNKDALLATLIGFGIGLLITGLLLLGPNIAKSLPVIHLPTITLPQKAKIKTPTPTPKEFSVTVESPLAEAIENNDSLLVSGTTSGGATVVISGFLDEQVLVTKDDGKFAGKISLSEGKNDIVVTAYSKGKQTSQTVTVYYTPETL